MYWMQIFELLAKKKRLFIDALFIGLKMLQFIKVIVPEGTIFFAGAVTKKLNVKLNFMNANFCVEQEYVY